MAPVFKKSIPNPREVRVPEKNGLIRYRPMKWICFIYYHINISIRSTSCLIARVRWQMTHSNTKEWQALQKHHAACFAKKPHCWTVEQFCTCTAKRWSEEILVRKGHTVASCTVKNKMEDSSSTNHFIPWKPTPPKLPQNGSPVTPCEKMSRIPQMANHNMA